MIKYYRLIDTECEGIKIQDYLSNHSRYFVYIEIDLSLNDIISIKDNELVTFKDKSYPIRNLDDIVLNIKPSYIAVSFKDDHRKSYFEDVSKQINRENKLKDLL